MNLTFTVGLIVAGLLIAFGLGFVLGRFLFNRSGLETLAGATQRARALLDGAEREVETARREIVERVQQEWDQKRTDFEEERADTRRQLQRQRQKLEKLKERLERRAQRVSSREALLHTTTDTVETLHARAEQYHRDAAELCRTAETLSREAEERHRETETRMRDAELLQKRLQAKQARLDQLTADHVRKLENIAGITREEAKRRLHEQMVDEAKLEAASMIKDVRDNARLTANREARKVVLTAIQRTAAGQTVENTVAVVSLESDDMKGRIIGREGRNIRAFEAATGTEVIVDDTPEAVIISGFDPVRRAIARQSLVKLIQDGRIHPARIEEVVAKVSDDINEEIVETGERAVIDLGLHGVHPELIRLVGRMRYRSSYGQNLLSHSIEVAKLASLMASELNLDAHKARRAGLLHDIGKVIEGDLENPHAIAGMELCRKYKEDPDVCNAVGAHHDEIEMTTPLAPIVQSADAISGARPGARREALESYIKRLEKLEELAAAFDGVERVYAIQAGRELRVIVNHQLVSDALAEQLASDISKKIESDMQYPGQIRVTVIREVRSVAYAK